jgi:hypothetical protein
MKNRVGRLARLSKVMQGARQLLAGRVQITCCGVLSSQQQARTGIDSKIGSGALEFNGAFDCRMLHSPTEPELDASERGQALR